MPRVVHVTTFARSGGGMQTLVRRHLARDGALGFSPEVAAIFETADGKTVSSGLGAKWHWTPHRLRSAFAQQVHPRTRGALVVYHNAWAMPLLAPGDGAERRIAYLHSDWPGFGAAIAASAPWCDGVVCYTEALAALVRQHVPSLPAESVSVAPVPIEPPADLPSFPRVAARALQVGFVGRLEIAQKRIDLLPALVRAVAGQRALADWHIIGDGPKRPWLMRQLRGLGAIRFHGWLTDEDYWRALDQLDVLVVLSDYETGPIVLLEGMSRGVLPLYPEIGGSAQEPARSVDPLCIFPRGDVVAAAKQLAQLSRIDRVPLIKRAHAAVAPFTGERFEAAYGGAWRAALNRPRRSLQNDSRPTRLSDMMPLALISRCYERALWR